MKGGPLAVGWAHLPAGASGACGPVPRAPCGPSDAHVCSDGIQDRRLESLLTVTREAEKWLAFSAGQAAANKTCSVERHSAFAQVSARIGANRRSEAVDEHVLVAAA